MFVKRNVVFSNLIFVANKLKEVYIWSSFFIFNFFIMEAVEVLSPFQVSMSAEREHEPVKLVSREEKFQKMSVVQAFMEQSGLDEEVFHTLCHECLFAATPFPFDILYADGTVSRMPDLSKEAVAVKVTHGYWGAFWLSLKTSYPQRMTAAEARQYVDELPAVNGKKWRLPTLLELEIFFNRQSDIALVVRLCRFFELQPLFLIGKGDPDGRFVQIRTDDGYSLSPFFPGGRNALNDGECAYCWPVLDV